ncbi:1-deoxy-D-xylulose 5-phosphate reductoisomerase [Deltaproteobacteria bacterium]|nr:1-deoxy-D-xylulose 5-phosphate reductoisomerase [Deltaproteobacteria bacterium]
MIDYITRLPEKPLPFPRRLVIMGSTGSIGISTLDVVGAQPENFPILALAGGRNTERLAEQAVKWRPSCLAVLDIQAENDLAARLAPLREKGYKPSIHHGQEGYAALASLAEADMVVSAQAGAAGLIATHAAVTAGKTVALANKESLVLAGKLLREAARKSGAVILPIDSEHNAIFQCLMGQETKSVSRLLLTASGGPFRGRDAAFLQSVTPANALAHPNWSMGAKITIDSATMMNKGLEVMEACHLYGLESEKITVLVHPQSIVHSLVEFRDSSLLAQLGPPDMRVAISYCLAWPQRMANAVPALDLVRCGTMTFEQPDATLFPCLSLARDALRMGSGMSIVLNAANEVAVEAFLAGRIPFPAIASTVENTMNGYARRTGACTQEPDTLEAIIHLDHLARRKAEEKIS